MNLPTVGSPPERESTLSSALTNSSSIAEGRGVDGRVVGLHDAQVMGVHTQREGSLGWCQC